MRFKNPAQRRRRSKQRSHLWAWRSSLRRQPVLTCVQYTLLSIRNARGMSALAPRPHSGKLALVASSDFVNASAVSERHRYEPRSRTARRPRGTLPPETRRVAALRG